LGERGGKNDTVSIYMWKKRAETTEGKEDKEGRKKGRQLKDWYPKDSRSEKRYLEKKSQKGCQCKRPGIMP